MCAASPAHAPHPRAWLGSRPSGVANAPPTTSATRAETPRRPLTFEPLTFQPLTFQLRGTARRPGDGLQLRVLEHSVVAVLAADAGMLVAAEGSPEVRPARAAVDRHRSRLHLLGDLVGAHGIGMPDRCRQPVAR